jgi:hypothetical protein
MDDTHRPQLATDAIYRGRAKAENAVEGCKFVVPHGRDASVLPS